jgi:predicted AAA+ superfamily ATPase
VHLARKLDLSRDSVYRNIYLLRDARLLNTLSAEGKAVSTLQKPDKIYLEKTNLGYSLTEQSDIGNLRETFLLNQLLNAKKAVFASAKGDFRYGNTVIEVGGKGKPGEAQKDWLVAAAEMETGIGKKILFRLFGFMY